MGFGGEIPHGESEVNKEFIQHAGGSLKKLLLKALGAVCCGLPSQRRQVFISWRKVTIPMTGLERALVLIVFPPSSSAHYVVFSRFQTRDQCKSAGKQ